MLLAGSRHSSAGSSSASSFSMPSWLPLRSVRWGEGGARTPPLGSSILVMVGLLGLVCLALLGLDGAGIARVRELGGIRPETRSAASEGLPSPGSNPPQDAPAASLQALADELKANSSGDPSLPTKSGSVAICVAGGLRLFQLTGASLVQHVLHAYKGADVFLHVPLDQDSHKVLLLPSIKRQLLKNASAPQVWALRGVTFLAQAPLDETTQGASVLVALGSPNGIQGLLQYFQLVQGCHTLIDKEERSNGFRYEWVVRTRPDTFWTAPAPPLEGIPQDAYLYPEGSSWRGFNDRLGIAKRALGGPALMRLSVLELLAGTRKKGDKYNSEVALQMHLAALGIKAKAQQYPFCTLTKRMYPFPPPSNSAPVFGLNGTALLSGAKCKPCHAVSTGEDALKVIQGLKTGLGQPWDGRRKKGADNGFALCNSSKPLEGNWTTIFDEQAGKLASSIRKEYNGTDKFQCISRLNRMLGTLDGYSGPPAHLLCQMKHWGPVLDTVGNKSSTVPDVVKAVGAVTPGRLAGTLQSFISLDHWDGQDVPLPRLNASRPCDPCHWVVRVSGQRATMAKKEQLQKVYKQHGWSLVKCGGVYHSQKCMFLFSTPK